MSGLQSIALDRFGLGTGALHEGRELKPTMSLVGCSHRR